jgi:hypothetical protein
MNPFLTEQFSRKPEQDPFDEITVALFSSKQANNQ